MYDHTILRSFQQLGMTVLVYGHPTRYARPYYFKVILASPEVSTAADFFGVSIRVLGT